MAGLGLPPPSTTPLPPQMPVPAAPAFGGGTTTMPSSSVNSFGPTFSVPAVTPASQAIDVEEALKKSRDAAFQQQQAQPVIQGLAAHIKKFWSVAKTAKQTVENEMLEALYARRGAYTPSKLAEISKQGQPPIYMLVASSKMRQLEALLRDVLIGTGTDKPWTIKPTPVPDLPMEEVQKIVMILQQEIEMAITSGIFPTMEEVRVRLRMYREQLETRLREEARIRCERMEQKMEDQLVEGGFLDALDSFLIDLSVFKTAFVKGPVIRRKPRLQWGQNNELTVKDDLHLCWERVDPFRLFPAPWAKDIGDSGAPLIEVHKLTREELNQMIGVEGYDEEAIKKVLEDYGTGGLRGWLDIESRKDAAEGDDQSSSTTSDTIDALQYWGSASGQMLIDWGMDKKSVPDPSKEHQVEAWLIGPYVIKAVLNADPLARRPYYGYSFQKVPDSVWGNCPYDLVKDSQNMCNAAARALAANLGIASGPQVAVLSDRMPAGEDITEMYPWKIWQFESDSMGGSAKPIEFFQPESNAQELMTVYERFSQLADEAVGIPRYMAGFNEGAGSASRTASGMSMMIGNASKVIKQVVGGVDIHIMTKLLDRLYYYNMRYGEDEDLKGDVRIVARGAMALTQKEAAQVRRNEFLQATANPIDMQIVGLEGRAEVLRAAAQNLDMNADRIVPPVAVIKERAAMMAMQQLAMQQQAAQDEGQPENGGSPKKAKSKNQELSNGAPVTDHFQPA